MASTSANWQNHRYNKPDLIIPDNEKETCLQIDTAFSGYTSRNMVKKEAEKILKYEDLTV